MPGQRAMREELAKAKIEALKRQLVPVILRPIEQLSVRQAGRLTGLNASTIARLRRGLKGYITLEGLVEAAMKLGVPVKINVRKPRVRK
jgi:DNA-directed RNA polymerase specialized sigma24 family protein